MSNRRLRRINAMERDERQRNSGSNNELDIRSLSALPVRRHAEGRNDADDVNSNDSSETDLNDQDDEMATNRSILWLCQEGQLRLALQRFDNLKRQDQEKLKQEIFQIGRDQNTALHEVLMGGTTERSSYRLAFQLVEHCRKHYPQEFRQSLSIRPPSHRRTPLHWAAWGNAELGLVRFLALANPDALLMDDADGRTPYQIFNRYFSQVRPTQDMLFRMTKGWRQSLIRRTIQKCVIRYFLQQQLRPFDKTHRQ
ncbi:hypothetical protein IV203_026308 [Nitzschia inconspicua]|uniref:ANK_REP_REGION domain-containing protein n=1 Tax=Nitzschia inconspicua TaxID=303405 RepID=A0A9K3LJ21_9STRA|nr:hypothetical protein IV203_026308 [Nitzschia inconspicua]